MTSLTPCVYPLIPITVSVFGANESAGFLKSFLLSVVYVLGIVVTYSILGVAVASTGAVFGQIMANPWVVGFISLILVSLGLSMFGVFEIRLPYAVQNRLNTVGGTGFAGAFAMGTVAGVIAAPCTGPALAVVLTYIATTGSLFLGFWLMFTYALGMGLLFIGIGTFSGLLSALPRSGGWMYVLENVFGIAIITMALYFLKDVFPPLQDFLQNSSRIFRDCRGVRARWGVARQVNATFQRYLPTDAIPKGVWVVAGGSGCLYVCWRYPTTCRTPLGLGLRRDPKGLKSPSAKTNS